jgi:hypothetical protein
MGRWVGGYVSRWMEGQQVHVPWVRHGHERRGGQGMEAVQAVFWKKRPMHRYVPLASEGRGVHRQHLDCVSNGGHGDLVSVPAWDMRWAWNRSVGRLVERRGEGRHWLGGGASEKPRGQGRAGQGRQLCSRAGTRRVLSRARPHAPHHLSSAITGWHFWQFWHCLSLPAAAPCLGTRVAARPCAWVHRGRGPNERLLSMSVSEVCDSEQEEAGTQGSSAGNQRTYGESPSRRHHPATLTSPSCTSGHLLCLTLTTMLPTLTDGADPTACTLPHALLSALPLLSVSSNGAPCYSQLRPRRHSSRCRRRLRCLFRTAAHWPLQSPNSPPSGGHGSYAGAAGQPLPCAREPPYLYLYALGIARQDETRPTRPLLPTLAAL